MKTRTRIGVFAGKTLASARGKGSLALCALAAAVVCTGREGRAQVITLTDQNSVAHINTASSAGMFDWFVDGQNQLAQQWFWYRVGVVSPELSIDTISAPSVVQSDARTLSTTYSNGNFSIAVSYLLTGSAPGSGHSDIGESIRINNLGNTTLDFHFFQYSDFDLGGVTEGQTVQLGTDLQGHYNEALQTGPGGLLTESVTSPGAARGEAAFFPLTLNKLNNGVADDLNNNAGPVGPGDVTWGLQWDFTIAPGTSALISKDKIIQLGVPEPSSLALLAVGLVGLVRRGRRA